jgi:bifunctional DNA-binding transcriptional regulator/antitoxin component of YhaV-PrlF toxin-antitoxin module
MQPLKLLDTARLSDSHSLHIPKAVWEKFGLNPGDLMGFYEPELGQLIIKKANP